MDEGGWRRQVSWSRRSYWICRRTTSELLGERSRPIAPQKTSTRSHSRVHAASWAIDERWTPSVSSVSTKPRASMQVPTCTDGERKTAVPAGFQFLELIPEEPQPPRRVRVD